MFFVAFNFVDLLSCLSFVSFSLFYTFYMAVVYARKIRLGLNIIAVNTNVAIQGGLSDVI